MKAITDSEFNKIREYVKLHYGLSFSDEKKMLIQSRLRAHVLDHNFDSLEDYFDFIKRDPKGESMTQFVNKITTNHTFFMRETEHFDYFRDVCLPHIHQTHADQRDLRLWCCASSSGEEAVTLQIIAQEFFKNFFKKTGEVWDTTMLATDISTTVLDKAVYGRYPTEALQNLPKHWQLEYFSKVDATNSQVKDSIRKKILYRRFNMMEPFKFKKRFQVIFCRNVMIYFDSAVRDAIVKKFFEVTEPGGYLFIGHSESISNTGSGYQYIKPAVYRKPI